MNPMSLGPIKGVVRTMNKEKTALFIDKHLNDSTISLRDLLKAYATDHGVLI